VNLLLQPHIYVALRQKQPIMVNGTHKPTYILE